MTAHLSNSDAVVLQKAAPKGRKAMAAILEARGIKPQTCMDVLKVYGFDFGGDGGTGSVVFESALANAKEKGRWLYGEQLTAGGFLLAFGDLYADEADIRVTDCSKIGADQKFRTAGRVSDDGQEVTFTQTLAEDAFVSTISAALPPSPQLTRYSGVVPGTDDGPAGGDETPATSEDRPDPEEGKGDDVSGSKNDAEAAGTPAVPASEVKAGGLPAVDSDEPIDFDEPPDGQQSDADLSDDEDRNGAMA